MHDGKDDIQPLDDRFRCPGTDQVAAATQFDLGARGGQPVLDGRPVGRAGRGLFDGAGREQSPAAVSAYPDGDGTEPAGSEPADDGERRGTGYQVFGGRTAEQHANPCPIVRSSWNIPQLFHAVPSVAQRAEAKRRPDGETGIPCIPAR